MNTNSARPLGEIQRSIGTDHQLSLGDQRRALRLVADVQSRALVTKLTEDARALLADAALDHVGALTALEQHLISVAPLGEARYREIVDSYTIATAAAIRRWR